MKTSLNLLFLALVLFSSCSKSGQNELESTTVATENEIYSEIMEINVTPENSYTFNLPDLENTFLHFEIIELSTGYAVRVQPSSTVQILDSSTFGYPDALKEDELIDADREWSTDGNFVLGTSVGNGGLFEGNGQRYLGFRVLGNGDGDFQYAWVLLNNNVGNTNLKILSYGVNQTSGNSIQAGAIE